MQILVLHASLIDGCSFIQTLLQSPGETITSPPSSYSSGSSACYDTNHITDGGLNTQAEWLNSHIGWLLKDITTTGWILGLQLTFP